MSMQFNGSVHADGWSDHMPTGHLRNVPMNNGAVDRESNTPQHHRKHQRAQTAAWVLLFVVAAGGLSMAAARQLDPVGFDAKLDAVVASAHDLGDKIADQFDNKKPAVNMDVTALGNTPQATSSSTTPTTTTTTAMASPSQAAASQPEAQPSTSPAPQQLLQQQPTGAGTPQPEPRPAPHVAPPAAEPVSKTPLAPPMAVTPLPLQTQPQQQVQPITPVSPVTSTPPIPPATQAPPATQTPPPPPQTQGPQAEQSSI